jgi:hypothetical protein
MSSDAAILKNMREIDLMRGVGINLTQSMSVRHSNDPRGLEPVHAAFVKHTSEKEQGDIDAAVHMSHAVGFWGYERAKAITSGALHPDYKMPNPAPYDIFMGADFINKHRDFIAENIQPGMKMSEGGEIGVGIPGMYLEHTSEVQDTKLNKYYKIDEHGLRARVINGATMNDLVEMEVAAQDVKNEIAADKEKSAKAFEEAKKRDLDMQENGIPFEMFQNDVPAGFYDDEPKIEINEPEDSLGEIIIETNEDKKIEDVSLNISDFEKPQMGSSDFIKNESKEISIELNN